MNSPHPFTSGVRAVVRIQTPPEYDPRSDQVIPGQPFSFDVLDPSTDIGRDLLSVTTQKRLNEPCGRFTLNLAPREVVRGYTWADLIPAYSLVEIWMQRYPQNPEPVLVMLGLTSAAMISAQMSGAQQTRQVQIHGREVSCVFVDQKVFYLPADPEQLQPEKVSSQAGISPLFSKAVALLGMVAIDPQLAYVGDSPAAVMGRFVRMCTEGQKTTWNQSATPMLNLDLPITIDPTTYKPTQNVLSELLVFDEQRAQERLFDPRAALPAAAQFKDIGVPIWNLMETWSDPAYQELFVRSVDLRDGLAALGIERTPQPIPARTRLVANELFFRKKPFAGRINEAGEIVGAHERGSQFDDDFISDPRENVFVRPEDVIELCVGRSVESSLVNVYRVRPRSISANTDADFNALLAPLMDDGTNAPASIRRFGPRLMKVDDYYFRNLGGNMTSDIEVARTRARLLWHWHRYEPLFKRGNYTLKGNPHVNIGMRMVTSDAMATVNEYYVTGVTQSISFGKQASFRTRVDVDRGWPVPWAPLPTALGL